MSSILDAYGRPIRTKDLGNELAGPMGWQRTRQFEPIAGSLTPDYLASILRSAMDGSSQEYLTLAQEMERRDLHYGSVLQTRKLAVAGLDLQVEAASDESKDQELADEVRRIVRSPGFSDLLSDLLDAIAKGFSVVEIMWMTSSSKWWPVEFKWRDPRWFTFDTDTDEVYLRDGRDGQHPPGEALAPAKFLVHYPRTRNDLKIYGGVACAVAVAHMCKSYTVSDWMVFLENFGHPLRLGRYNAGATDKDVAILKRAVMAIGAQAAAVLPDSMRIEFEAPPNTTGGEKLFRDTADWWDRQVSKAVLGQTMTTDDGSSLAQAQVHDQVRQDIRESDTRRLCNTLNRQLVEPFINLNFGPREDGAYPRIYYPFREGLDAKALSLLLPHGLRVSQSVVRDRLGLPDPDDDEEVLERALPLTSNQTDLNTALNAPQSSVEPDAILAEIEQEALSEWEPLAAEIINPIERAVAESSSYEELEMKLLELSESIDPAELTRALALASWTARGMGNAQQG